MPYKEKKDQVAWRNSRTSNYMKWLYAKRKLKADEARVYEKLLEDIVAGLVTDPIPAAWNTLTWKHDREREIGNRFDHENDKPYWKEPT